MLILTAGLTVMTVLYLKFRIFDQIPEEPQARNPTVATLADNAPLASPQAPTVQRMDTQVGQGAEATPGMRLKVHYTGWLYDPLAPHQRGQQFDSSHARNEPLPLKLGAHQVIPGWEEGLIGMKVGGKRTLIIPPDLAYGARGAGNLIPPNATLIFDVELVEALKP